MENDINLTVKELPCKLKVCPSVTQRLKILFMGRFYINLNFKQK